MIEILTDYPEGILAFSATSEVTADDYKNVLVPAIEKSIEQYNKITA
ncbi:MAG: STAS/SEC14 domain-containing protein, partial [Gammaproteobacteria bacterium]